MDGKKRGVPFYRDASLKWMIFLEIIKKLFGCDLSIVYFEYTHFVHRHTAVLFVGNIHFHCAGKEVAGYDRIGYLSAMNFFYGT